MMARALVTSCSWMATMSLLRSRGTAPRIKTELTKLKGDVLGTIFSNWLQALGSYLGDGLVGEELLRVGVDVPVGEVLVPVLGFSSWDLKRISWLRVRRKRSWWGTGWSLWSRICRIKCANYDYGIVREIVKIVIFWFKKFKIWKWGFIFSRFKMAKMVSRWSWRRFCSCCRVISSLSLSNYAGLLGDGFGALLQ